MSDDRTSALQRAQADIILHGMKEIADYLQIKVRAGYHLASSKRLPIFRLGTAKMHARKSALDQFIAEQERRNSGEELEANGPTSEPASHLNGK